MLLMGVGSDGVVLPEQTISNGRVTIRPTPNSAQHGCTAMPVK